MHGKGRGLALESPHHHRSHVRKIIEFVLHIIKLDNDRNNCLIYFMCSILVIDLVRIGLWAGDALLGTIMNFLLQIKDTGVKSP